MCKPHMFVWSFNQFGELDPQSSKVCLKIGTLMTGKNTTCLPQAEVTQVIGHTLKLKESQITDSLHTLANQRLITIANGLIDASNIFLTE